MSPSVNSTTTPIKGFIRKPEKTAIEGTRFKFGGIYDQYKKGRISVKKDLTTEMGLLNYKGTTGDIQSYYWENGRYDDSSRQAIYTKLDAAITGFFKEKISKDQNPEQLFKLLTSKFEPKTIDQMITLMLLMVDIENMSSENASIKSKYTDFLINNKDKIMSEYIDLKLSDGDFLLRHPDQRADYKLFLAEHYINNSEFGKATIILKDIDSLLKKIDANGAVLAEIKDTNIDKKTIGETNAIYAVMEPRKSVIKLRANLAKMSYYSAKLDTLSSDKTDAATALRYKTDIRKLVAPNIRTYNALPDEKSKNDNLVFKVYTQLALFGIDKNEKNAKVIMKFLSDPRLKKNTPILDGVRLALSEFYVAEKSRDLVQANNLLTQVNNKQAPRFKLAKSQFILLGIEAKNSIGEDTTADVASLKGIVGTLADSYFDGIKSQKIKYYLKQNQLEYKLLNKTLVAADLSKLTEYAKGNDELVFSANVFVANFHLGNVADKEDDDNIKSAYTSLNNVPKKYQTEVDFKLSKMNLLLKRGNFATASALMLTITGDLKNDQVFSLEIAKLQIANGLGASVSNDFIEGLKEMAGKNQSKLIDISVLHAVNYLNRKKKSSDDESNASKALGILGEAVKLLPEQDKRTSDQKIAQNNIILLTGIGYFQNKNYLEASKIFSDLLAGYDLTNMKPLVKKEYVRIVSVYFATYLKSNKVGNELKLDAINIDKLLPSTLIGEDKVLNNLKLSMTLDLEFAKEEYATILRGTEFLLKFADAGKVVNQKLSLLQAFSKLYESNGNKESIEAAKVTQSYFNKIDLPDVDNKILVISLEQEIKYFNKTITKTTELVKETAALNQQIKDAFQNEKLEDHQKTQLVEIYRNFLQRTNQDTEEFDALIGSNKKMPKGTLFIYQLATEVNKDEIGIKSKVIALEDFKANFPTNAAKRLSEVLKAQKTILNSEKPSEFSEQINALRQVQMFEEALTLTAVALNKFKNDNEQKELLKMQVELKIEVLMFKKPSERTAAEVSEISGLISEYSSKLKDAESQAEVQLLRMALATATNKKIDWKVDTSSIPSNKKKAFEFREQMMLVYNEMALNKSVDYGEIKNAIKSAYKAMPFVDQADYAEALNGIYIRMVDHAKGDYGVANLTEKEVVPMSWDQAATLLSATDRSAALQVLEGLTKAKTENSFIRIKATLAGYKGWSYIEAERTYPEKLADKEYGFMTTPFGVRWIDDSQASVGDVAGTIPVATIDDRSVEGRWFLGKMSLDLNSATKSVNFKTAQDPMIAHANNNNTLVDGINAQQETVTRTGTGVTIIRQPIEGETPNGDTYIEVEVPYTYTYDEDVLTPKDLGLKTFDPDANYLLDNQQLSLGLPVNDTFSLRAGYSENKSIMRKKGIVDINPSEEDKTGTLMDVRKFSLGADFQGEGTQAGLNYNHYLKNEQPGSIVGGYEGKFLMQNKPEVTDELSLYINKELSENFTFMGYYQIDDRGQYHGSLALQYMDTETSKIMVYITKGKYDYLGADGAYDSVEATTLGVRGDKKINTAIGEFNLFLEAQLRSNTNENKIEDGLLVQAGIEHRKDLGEGASVTTGVVATVQNSGEGQLSSIRAAVVYRDNLRRMVEDKVLGTEVEITLKAAEQASLKALLGLNNDGKRAEIVKYNGEKYKDAFMIVDGQLVCKNRKLFNELIAELGNREEYQLANALLLNNMKSKLTKFSDTDFDGVNKKEVEEYNILLSQIENMGSIFIDSDKAEFQYGFLKSLDPLANTLLAKISYEVSLQYILAEAFVLANDPNKSDETLPFKIEQLEELMATFKLRIQDLDFLGFDTEIKLGSSLVNILNHPSALINVGVELKKDFRVTEKTKLRLGAEISTFDTHLHAEVLIDLDKYMLSLGNNIGLEVLDDSRSKVSFGAKVDLLGLFTGLGRMAAGVTFGNEEGSAMHGGEVTWAGFGLTGLIIRKEKNPGQQSRFSTGEIVSAVDYFGRTNYQMLAASVGSDHFQDLKEWVNDICTPPAGIEASKISIFYDRQDAAKLYPKERMQELKLLKQVVAELYRRKEKGYAGYKLINAVFLNRDENEFEGDTLSIDMDSLKSMVKAINKAKNKHEAMTTAINNYLSKLVKNEKGNIRSSMHKALITELDKTDLSKVFEFSKDWNQKQIDANLAYFKNDLIKHIEHLAKHGLEFDFTNTKLISRIVNNESALRGLLKMLTVFKSELDDNVKDMVLSIDDTGFFGLFRSKEVSQYSIEIAFENIKSVGRDNDDISDNSILNKLKGEIYNINYVDRNLSSLMAMLQKQRIDADFSYNEKRSAAIGENVFSIAMRGTGKRKEERKNYEVHVTKNGVMKMYFMTKGGNKQEIKINSQSDVFHRALFLMFKGGGRVPSAYVKMFEKAKINAAENAKVEAATANNSERDHVAIDNAKVELQAKTKELKTKEQELSDKTKDFEQLTLRLERATEAIENADDRIALLAATIRTDSSELEKANLAVGAKQEAVEALKVAKINLEKNIAKLIKDTSVASKVIEGKKSELVALTKEIEEKTKAFATTESLAKKLYSYRAEAHRLDGQVKAKQSELKAEKKKFDDYIPFNENQTKVNKLSAEVRTLTKSLSLKSTELKNAKTAQDSLPDLATAIGVLQYKAKEQAENIAVLVAASEKLGKSLAIKQTEINPMDAKIGAAEGVVVKAQDAAKIINKRIKNNSLLLNQANINIMSFEKTINATEPEQTSAKAEVADLTKNVKKLKAVVATIAVTVPQKLKKLTTGSAQSGAISVVGEKAFAEHINSSDVKARLIAELNNGSLSTGRSSVRNIRLVQVLGYNNMSAEQVDQIVRAIQALVYGKGSPAIDGQLGSKSVEQLLEYLNSNKENSDKIVVKAVRAGKKQLKEKISVPIGKIDITKQLDKFENGAGLFGREVDLYESKGWRKVDKPGDITKNEMIQAILYLDGQNLAASLSNSKSILKNDRAVNVNLRKMMEDNKADDLKDLYYLALAKWMIASKADLRAELKEIDDKAAKKQLIIALNKLGIR